MHPREFFSIRRPRLRRFGAWLAIAAIGLHLLVAATHRPANAVPLSHDAEHCMESDGKHRGDAPLHDKSNGLAHHAKFCAICQSLQAGGTPLLESCISVDAPTAVAEIRHACAKQPWIARRGYGILHLRGPPELRLV
jgi:hypothetical protein